MLIARPPAWRYRDRLQRRGLQVVEPSQAAVSMAIGATASTGGGCWRRLSRPLMTSNKEQERLRAALQPSRHSSARPQRRRPSRRPRCLRGRRSPAHGTRVVVALMCGVEKHSRARRRGLKLGSTSRTRRAGHPQGRPVSSSSIGTRLVDQPPRALFPPRSRRLASDSMRRLRMWRVEAFNGVCD